MHVYKAAGCILIERYKMIRAGCILPPVLPEVRSLSLGEKTSKVSARFRICPFNRLNSTRSKVNEIDKYLLATHKI